MHGPLAFMIAAAVWAGIAGDSTVAQARPGPPLVIPRREVAVVVAGDHIYVWPCHPWYARRIAPESVRILIRKGSAPLWSEEDPRADDRMAGVLRLQWDESGGEHREEVLAGGAVRYLDRGWILRCPLPNGFKGLVWARWMDGLRPDGPDAVYWVQAGPNVQESDAMFVNEALRLLGHENAFVRWVALLAVDGGGSWYVLCCRRLLEQLWNLPTGEHRSAIERAARIYWLGWNTGVDNQAVDVLERGGRNIGLHEATALDRIFWEARVKIEETNARHERISVERKGSKDDAKARRLVEEARAALRSFGEAARSIVSDEKFLENVAYRCTAFCFTEESLLPLSQGGSEEQARSVIGRPRGEGGGALPAGGFGLQVPREAWVGEDGWAAIDVVLPPGVENADRVLEDGRLRVWLEPAADDNTTRKEQSQDAVQFEARQGCVWTVWVQVPDDSPTGKLKVALQRVGKQENGPISRVLVRRATALERECLAVLSLVLPWADAASADVRYAAASVAQTLLWSSLGGGAMRAALAADRRKASGLRRQALDRWSAFGWAGWSDRTDRCRRWTAPLELCAGAWPIELLAMQQGPRDAELAEWVYGAGRKYFVRMAQSWLLGDVRFDTWAKQRTSLREELEQELRKRVDAKMSGVIVKWIEGTEERQGDSFVHWMGEGLLHPFTIPKEPDSEVR